jgi:acetylglutamate kinase
VSVRVVKIGGAALADGDWLDAFAAHVAREAPSVIVHGGGPDISALSEKLGVAVNWSNGRRVTTPEALDVASMVLTGRINKRIVGALLDAGVDALGISGEDGALVRARVVEAGALGRVGAVEQVRAELIEWLLGRGMVPVLSPISRAQDGGALNVNADEVAGAVAAALGAPELLFVTDVEGVRDGTGVMRAELSAAAARELIETRAAHGGMAVKLEAALRALAAGVPAIRIGRFEAMHDDNAGTRIRAQQEVAIWQ